MSVVLTAVSVVSSEWVEIPQVVISAETEMSLKTDPATYTITTTSTTTETSVLAKPVTDLGSKPAASKETDSSKIVTSTQRSVIQKAVFPKPTVFRNFERPHDKIANNTISNYQDIVLGNSNKTSFEVGTNQASSSVNNTASNFNVNKKSGTDDKYLHVENDDSEEFTSSETLEEEDGYTYANFIPYLSAVQSTLMRNAHQNKKSKLNVLRDLRDHLFIEIENRMSTLWNPKIEGRSARDYKDDSHVDFPSNEGALMTIGFLTFAVFLIKLVLHLIQTIGNKGNDNGTTTTLIGRKRRSVTDDETIQILSYIEEFRLK